MLSNWNRQQCIECPLGARIWVAKEYKDEEYGSCLREGTDLCTWKAKIQNCTKTVSASCWYSNTKEQTTPKSVAWNNKLYILTHSYVSWLGVSWSRLDLVGLGVNLQVEFRFVPHDPHPLWTSKLARACSSHSDDRSATGANGNLQWPLKPGFRTGTPRTMGWGRMLDL